MLLLLKIHDPQIILTFFNLINDLNGAEFDDNRTFDLDCDNFWEVKKN